MQLVSKTKGSGLLLNFRISEYFMVIFFGYSVTSLVSEQSPLKSDESLPLTKTDRPIASLSDATK